MALLDKHAGLYTDHYELTMAQGYFLNGMKDVPACFDYFFRTNPFGNGYSVFAGLGDLLEIFGRMRFDDEDRAYLRSIGFAPSFIDFLEEFEFRADVYAASEGEVVFPFEPLVRVEGSIVEAQLVETLLLNILNFETLIATKAARMRLVAGNRTVIDFGLRRAQGFGGILASKAAVIGGANSTSNVYSAFLFGLPSTGTQAHSWIQAYDDELTAFRAFARAFPGRCVLLVDTYDTLRSGMPNAITTAREMEARGERLFGVRLDSGDLAYLSKKARSLLDEAGLGYVKVVVSNKLDEYIIRSLVEQGAPVDAFGVGTRLVTGQPDAALDGVYKLSMSDRKPRLKLSEDPEKIILPGRKNVFRFIDDQGQFVADGIALDDEDDVQVIYHPRQAGKKILAAYDREPLLRKVMERGKEIMPGRRPAEAAAFARARLGQLPDEHKRFENPHVYKVGITKRLMELRSALADEVRRKIAGGQEHNDKRRASS
jgi:nicotinate phosphoribosyltransferase